MAQNKDATRYSRKAIIASVLITAMVMVGGIIILGVIRKHNAASSSASLDAQTSSSHTLTGTMSLHDPTSFAGLASGASCSGSGGYSDISTDAQVTVSDGASTVLAVSNLNPGKADGSGNCVFDFTVNNVPNANFYQVEVSHRGKLDYSYQQLSADNFQISTTLGQN